MSIKLQKPVAVFDAGIGSYAIVDLIHHRQPQRDILYFADRASFPYGHKNADQLAKIMQSTFRLLETYDPSAIIIASNAPSIMVYDRVKDLASVPVYGVFPPLEEAENLSKTGHIAIMGVASMVESEMGRQFVQKHSAKPERVLLYNASPMVELVESGAFLFDERGTQNKVNAFIQTVLAYNPLIDVVTLSSTHLPWLRSYFEKAAPQIHFLDPAEKIVDTLPVSHQGNGHILGLVTESADYDMATFRAMLDKIGAKISLERVVRSRVQ